MAIPREVCFADLLRAYRKARDLTQEELAEKAGLSRRGVSQLESDSSRRPYQHTVARLADALELTDAERTTFEAVARRGESARSGAATPTFLTNPVLAPMRSSSMPALVGRARELALIERHLAVERDDEPPLLLLAGEPGIGKSRLLAETATQAQEAGWRVLAGGCVRSSGQAPYEPFVTVLARALAATPPVHQRLDLTGCAWLARLLPELEETAVIPAPAWRLPPEQERRLVFGAVARYLTNVAGPAGTLLLLDDLQWVGGDAISLLEALVIEMSEPGRSAPFRLLGAYRATEVRLEDPLALLMADLARDERVVCHHLGPLSHEEGAALLAQLWPEDEDTDAHVRETTVRRAGGIPFFLMSIARSMREGAVHDGVGSQARVPVSVAESVQARLAVLPLAARRLAGVTAVAGRIISGGLLTSISEYPEGETLDALNALTHAGLLAEEGEGAYRFTHDLIQEVVEGALESQRRRSLHRRMAEIMEGGASHRLQATEIAAHFIAAREPQRALPYVLLAGDQAMAVYAHAEAEGHYRAAVGLARELRDQAREAWTLEKLSAVVTVSGQLDTASELLDQCIRAYQTIHDQEGELRALAALMPIYGDRGEADAGAARAHATLSVVAAHDSGRLAASLATVYLGLASLYFDNGRNEDHLVAAKRAAELSRIAKDDRLLVQALHWQDLAAFNLHRDEEMVDKLALIAQAEQIGETWIAAWSLVHVAQRCSLSGEIERGRPYAARALELANQRQDPALIAGMWISAGRLSYYLGEWGRAHDEWAQAAAIRRELDQFSTAWGSANPPLWLGTLAVAQGRVEEGKRSLELAMTLAESIGFPGPLALAGAVLAECELLVGHAAEARARLNLLVERYNLLPTQRWIERSALLPLEIWADLELGQLEEAEAGLATALTTVPRLHYVDIVRAQALLEMKRARWRAAAVALDETLAMCRAMPYPYAEAKTLWVYGRLEVARNEIVAAQARFTEALAICDRLGEGLYRPRIEQDLERVVRPQG